jgi:hypothetical protein
MKGNHSRDFHINNVTDYGSLSNLFSDHFKSACTPNNPDLNANMKSLFLENTAGCHNETVCPDFSVELIQNALNKIGLHASPGHDSIVGEHLMYAHPSLLVIISKMFNMFVFTGFSLLTFVWVLLRLYPKKKSLEQTDLLKISGELLSIRVLPSYLKFVFFHLLIIFKLAIIILVLKRYGYSRCHPQC